MIAMLVLVIYGQVHGFRRSKDRHRLLTAAAVGGRNGINARERSRHFVPRSRWWMHASVMRINESVSHWQFDAIRSRYESLLKRATTSGENAVEEAVRVRLGPSSSRDERSVEAARTIENILAQSHRRDREVAAEDAV